jgi:endonuclease/exonuclease/phosphatase family metal-dependent hydrolase
VEFVSVSHLRIVTWNCRSGLAAKRLSELAEHEAHVVFLQECRPSETLSPPHVVCQRAINGAKGIALAVPAASYHCVPRALPGGSGRAVIAAQVLAPVPFTVLGIWAQGPGYADDVMLTLQAHADLLRTEHVVVVGDLNSGSRLDRRRSLTRNHKRLLDLCGELELVSAYHAFHRIDPGDESHATYFHQFKRSQPWHIDFCFIPRRWSSRLIRVTILDGRRWAKRSDHRPLLVELDTSRMRR